MPSRFSVFGNARRCDNNCSLKYASTVDWIGASCSSTSPVSGLSISANRRQPRAASTAPVLPSVPASDHGRVGRLHVADARPQSRANRARGFRGRVVCTVTERTPRACSTRTIVRRVADAESKELTHWKNRSPHSRGTSNLPQGARVIANGRSGRCARRRRCNSGKPGHSPYALGPYRDRCRPGASTGTAGGSTVTFSSRTAAG